MHRAPPKFGWLVIERQADCITLNGSARKDRAIQLAGEWVFPSPEIPGQHVHEFRQSSRIPFHPSSLRASLMLPIGSLSPINECDTI